DLDAWLAQRDFDLPPGDDIELHAVLSRELEVLLRERPLAPDQQLEAAGDHEFVLRARVADTMRLRWWLLGFGDRITVLGPDRLREEMAATVRRMAAVYAGDAARDSMETSRTPATDMAVSAARNVQTAAHR
ncbi:MAG: WYL domain-containing protein, partial [Lysobacterales bacterium]